MERPSGLGHGWDGGGQAEFEEGVLQGLCSSQALVGLVPVCVCVCVCVRRGP